MYHHNIGTLIINQCSKYRQHIPDITGYFSVPHLSLFQRSFVLSIYPPCCRMPGSHNNSLDIIKTAVWASPTVMRQGVFVYNQCFLFCAVQGLAHVYVDKQLNETGFCIAG